MLYINKYAYIDTNNSLTHIISFWHSDFLLPVFFFCRQTLVLCILSFESESESQKLLRKNCNTSKCVSSKLPSNSTFGGYRMLSVELTRKRSSLLEPCLIKHTCWEIIDRRWSCRHGAVGRHGVFVLSTSSIGSQLYGVCGQFSTFILCKWLTKGIKIMTSFTGVYHTAAYNGCLLDRLRLGRSKWYEIAILEKQIYIEWNTRILQHK